MKFVIRDRESKDAAISYIDKLPEDKAYDLSVTQKKSKRTLSQNSLYWLYLSCISDETGGDKDDLHMFFRKKYLKRGELIFGNESITSTYSTKQLDTKLFTEYIDKIVIFASSELGIILPNPSDKYWEQFYEQYKDTL